MLNWSLGAWGAGEPEEDGRDDDDTKRQASESYRSPTAVPCTASIVADATMRRARDIILGADNRVSESIKWKTPTFAYKGNIASFFPKSKQHASLMFHAGASRRSSSASRRPEGCRAAPRASPRAGTHRTVEGAATPSFRALAWSSREGA